MMSCANKSDEAVYPQAFSSGRMSKGAAAYLNDPSIGRLAHFFNRKGLAAIKDEDRREQWYEDWLAYQSEHGLYASVLSPGRYSTLGSEFDLLRLTRFIEVFAYFSPAHGYSFQVSFLGLFSILMGANAALKREAVAALEKGGLLAFGLSEQNHGSDLFGNEFTVEETAAGRLVANGAKYYIGNANSASIVSVLGRKDARKDTPRYGRQGESNNADPSPTAVRARRMPFILFALRPGASGAVRNVRKICTLGVRSAFVGSFEVKDHALEAADVIAEGREAWDAVFGTVTLGKFFLGFGSIGICEHAFDEAAAHLSRRILYGKPVLAMLHIRLATAQAYARLAAMKLYAYRALDYLRAANGADRRYLLFAAVQKAKVSTEGVKVLALLSECVGARGFEADTYFEMALRDALLIPGLEGSTHINLGLAAQFVPGYFARRRPVAQPLANWAEPDSLVAGEAPGGENLYLTEARTGAFSSITFPPFLAAYAPLMSLPNVRVFARQANAFGLFVRKRNSKRSATADSDTTMLLGQCLATIAYGQLLAENSRRLSVPPQLVSAMFDGIISDLSTSALALASSPRLSVVGKVLIRRAVAAARTTAAEWDFVAGRVAELGRGDETEKV